MSDTEKCPNCGDSWDFEYSDWHGSSEYFYYFCDDCVEWFESANGKELIKNVGSVAACDRG